jgi:hypothetical protein
MVRRLGLVVIFACVSGTAAAHSRLTAPMPRNPFDDVKEGSATRPPPCGGPRSTVVMSKQIGDSILVEWDETIDHLGHYEILFSMANDQNFTFLTDPAGATLNNIPDVEGGTLPHHYKQMVKLPSAPCPACTLQLKQFMEGAGYYHSCADMELRAATVPGVDGGVAPDDAGMLPDLSDPTATQPSTEPSTDPSTAPQAATPDLAMAAPTGTPQSGNLEVDYGYGCDISGGAGTSWFPLLLFLFALGVRLRPRRR